jgi:hypothetical protein
MTNTVGKLWPFKGVGGGGGGGNGRKDEALTGADSEGKVGSYL